MSITETETYDNSQEGLCLLNSCIILQNLLDAKTGEDLNAVVIEARTFLNENGFIRENIFGE